MLGRVLANVGYALILGCPPGYLVYELTRWAVGFPSDDTIGLLFSLMGALFICAYALASKPDAQ